MEHKLAIIGFGTVSQGFLMLLRERQKYLHTNLDLDMQIVAISDAVKGSVCNVNGLDIDTLIDVCVEHNDLTKYPDEQGISRDYDSFKTIERSKAHTVIETTPTNTETGQPAIDHTKAAFTNNQNVVTTNKGPAALAHDELKQLAGQYGVHWGIEGTVMSGTPIFTLISTCLYGNEITEVKGILNGTSNYILSRMDDGSSFNEALEEAKLKGYAETDSKNDIEGYDALYKALILSNRVFNKSLRTSDVLVKGISEIGRDDITAAHADGYKWKQLVRLRKEQDNLKGSVTLEKIPTTDPLANVSGATNALTIDCDVLGPVTITGPGAGQRETGFSLLSDCVEISLMQ